MLFSGLLFPARFGAQGIVKRRQFSDDMSANLSHIAMVPQVFPEIVAPNPSNSEVKPVKPVKSFYAAKSWKSHIRSRLWKREVHGSWRGQRPFPQSRRSRWSAEVMEWSAPSCWSCQYGLVWNVFNGYMWLCPPRDKPVICLHIGSKGATNESKLLGVGAFLEAAVELRGRHSGTCCRVIILASNLSSIDRLRNKNKNRTQNWWQ